MGMYDNTLHEQPYHNDSKDIGAPVSDRELHLQEAEV
jgi:hypothetical protein